MGSPLARCPGDLSRRPPGTTRCRSPLFTAWLYEIYGSYSVPECWNAAFAWTGLAIATLGLARRTLVRSTAAEASG
jgi:hypothetical protein